MERLPVTLVRSCLSFPVATGKYNNDPGSSAESGMLNFTGYFARGNTHSKNTDAAFSGRKVPYLPQNRATVGLTWAGDQRMIVSAQAVWRSVRFADEVNLVPLSSGWDMTLKLHSELTDKRWNVEACATNLFKRSVEDPIGVNLIARSQAVSVKKYSNVHVE